MKRALILVITCALAPLTWAEYQAPRASEAPVIDGYPGDPAWAAARWRDVPYLLEGTYPAPQDLAVRYKVVWDEHYLYLLAQIVDDVLIDTRADPLDHYWEDDTLEIFLDEDASGGDHRYDYNAFAYHIGLDNQAVDMGPFMSQRHRLEGRENILVFDKHITSQWRRGPRYIHWEVRVEVHSDRYGSGESSRQTLAVGDIMGFLVAYCDADTGSGRQHFLSDTDIAPRGGDRNLAWLTADVFGRLILVE